MNSLQQSSEIAYGEKPRQALIVWEFGVAHPGIVIRSGHAVKTNVAIGPYAGGHVSFSIIVERFRKVVRRAAHIAEMDEEYLFLLPKMSDDRGQIVRHQREIALTEAYSI